MAISIQQRVFICLATFYLCFSTQISDQMEETKSSKVDAKDKMELSVYYESLCPDSRRFFINQLGPVYAELSDYIDLDLVPFGHARILGTNKMVCQHGPRECNGNRLMACTQDRKINGSKQDEILATLTCYFSTAEYENCVTKFLPGVKYEDLEKCANSEVSFKMMTENEVSTGRVSYVPHIKINRRYSEETQDCEMDLKGCVCNYYRNISISIPGC